MTKESKFIQEATNKFGSRFDYSKVAYTNSENKVIISCSVHGEFKIAPYTFLRSREGCQKCSKAGIATKWTLSKFIEKAKDKFGKTFDYSLAEYVNSKTKLKITCYIHGEFSQTPEKHLAQKHGCPKCATEATRSQLLRTTADFIKASKRIHGEMFNYANAVYTGYAKQVTLQCNNCNAIITPTVNSHMNGSKCANCCTTGFRKDKPAILYYLSINNGQAYKIGVTNRTVSERFNLTDLQSIDVIHIEHYSSGAKCIEREKAILTEFTNNKYLGPPLLASGNTELFTCDVLNLDKGPNR